MPDSQGKYGVNEMFTPANKERWFLFDDTLLDPAFQDQVISVRYKAGGRTQSNISFAIINNQAVLVLKGKQMREFLIGKEAKASGKPKGGYRDEKKKLFQQALVENLGAFFDADLKIKSGISAATVRTQLASIAAESMQARQLADGVYYYLDTCLPAGKEQEITGKPLEMINLVGLETKDRSTKVIPDKSIFIVIDAGKVRICNTGNVIRRREDREEWINSLTDTVREMLQEYVNPDLTIKAGKEAALRSFIDKTHTEFEKLRESFNRRRLENIRRDVMYTPNRSNTKMPEDLPEGATVYRCSDKFTADKFRDTEHNRKFPALRYVFINNEIRCVMNVASTNDHIERENSHGTYSSITRIAFADLVKEGLVTISSNGVIKVTEGKKDEVIKAMEMQPETKKTFDASGTSRPRISPTASMSSSSTVTASTRFPSSASSSSLASASSSSSASTTQVVPTPRKRVRRGPDAVESVRREPDAVASTKLVLEEHPAITHGYIRAVEESKAAEHERVKRAREEREQQEQFERDREAFERMPDAMVFGEGEDPFADLFEDDKATHAGATATTTSSSSRHDDLYAILGPDDSKVLASLLEPFGDEDADAIRKVFLEDHLETLRSYQGVDPSPSPTSSGTSSNPGKRRRR